MKPETAAFLAKARAFLVKARMLGIGWAEQPAELAEPRIWCAATDLQPRAIDRHTATAAVIRRQATASLRERRR